MPSFDMTCADFTPWLADRLLSDHFIEQRRRAAFLWRHFCGSGLLGGVDLADGTKYEILRPADPVAFLLAHALGPARIDTPPEVSATTKEGRTVELASFFRTTTKHADDDEMCPFLVVRFDGQNSLRPGREVIQASHALHGAGYPHAIERSFQIGVWNLWVFFAPAVTVQQAKDVATAIRDAIGSAGVESSAFSIPLIDGDSSSVYVPYHFFSGDYFANLHELDNRQELVALNPNRIEVMAVPTSALPESDNYRSEETPQAAPITRFLEAWHASKRGRPARAGELADLVAEQGILIPELAAFESRQARAINLGRILMDAASNNSIEGWSISAGKSGNSNVFRLERDG